MPRAGSSSASAIFASGLPPGLSAVRTTEDGSTDRRLFVASSDPEWASKTRAGRSLLKSWPLRTTSPWRQSPAPATSAYSNVWVQCWNWKFEPSGTERRGGSIHTPDGQPLQPRISDRNIVPSASTLKPGSPRLSSATV